MAKQIEAVCRLCRREGEKLFLKGLRCTSDKCAVTLREYAPGQHGKVAKRKLSNYAAQLREKQKAKRIYGLLERQFRHYFEMAERAKGATGEVLLQLLERRIDNVVLRANFATSRATSRQLVSHGFIRCNGKRVDVPSYLVNIGNEITVAGKPDVIKQVRESVKLLEGRGIPDWMEVSNENLTIKIKRLPTKSDIGMAIQESLIVELYSK